MKISGIPPPEQFWFRCEECGEYRVTEKTARKFLTKRLRKKLDDALKKGAEGAVLTFENGCPNCKPDNRDAVVELSAIKRRVH